MTLKDSALTQSNPLGFYNNKQHNCQAQWLHNFEVQQFYNNKLLSPMTWTKLQQYFE